MVKLHQRKENNKCHLLSGLAEINCIIRNIGEPKIQNSTNDLRICQVAVIYLMYTLFGKYLSWRHCSWQPWSWQYSSWKRSSCQVETVWFSIFDIFIAGLRHCQLPGEKSEHRPPTCRELSNQMYEPEGARELWTWRQLLRTRLALVQLGIVHHGRWDAVWDRKEEEVQVNRIQNVWSKWTMEKDGKECMESHEQVW